MATVQTITSTSAEQRLQAAREALAPLQSELKAINSQLADQILAKELGAGFNAAEVIRLRDQKTAVESKIASEQSVVDAIHERTQQIRANEDRAAFEARCARLKEIASHNETLEARYFTAAEELVSVAATISINRSEMSGLRMELGSYCQRYGITTNPLPGVREPFQPFEIPRKFLQDAKPYGTFDQWLREWRTNRGITEKGK
jgi:hypothetical protein